MESFHTSILVVDDHLFYLDILTQGLRFAFPELLILGAASGAEAVAILETSKIDLVITDLCMPEIDGFDVLMKLQELGLSIPTIVISGFGFTKASDLARDFGTRLFLEKPIDFDTLSHAVRGILQGRSKEDTIVKGFSLSSFLQLMELDRKTGTLTILADNNEGIVCFEMGTLNYVATGTESGKRALFDILGWSLPEIRISNQTVSHEPNIFTPLSSLLLEGFHTLDEIKGALEA